MLTLPPSAMNSKKGACIILTSTEHLMVHYVDEIMGIQPDEQEVTSMIDYLVRSMHSRIRKINSEDLVSHTYEIFRDLIA